MQVLGDGGILSPGLAMYDENGKFLRGFHEGYTGLVKPLGVAIPGSSYDYILIVADFGLRPIIGPTGDPPPPQNGSTSINMDQHGSKWINMTYRG